MIQCYIFVLLEFFSLYSYNDIVILSRSSFNLNHKHCKAPLCFTIVIIIIVIIVIVAMFVIVNMFVNVNVLVIANMISIEIVILIMPILTAFAIAIRLIYVLAP